MAADRDVEVDIIASDKTSRATRSAARNFDQLNKRVKNATKSLDSGSSAGTRFGKAMGVVARTAGKATSAVAAAGASVGTLVTGLIGVVKYGTLAAKAVAGMAPLVAFLPGLAGSAGLVAGTLKLIGPGLVNALKPITSVFADADGEATKFTKSLQALASRGVEPIAKEFAKVNLPSIQSAMERISISVNKVVTGFGNWLNTVEGQKLIEQISNSTATAMEKLGPKIQAAAIALGRLAGKAGDKALVTLTDVVGRLLDKFTNWANSKSSEDIESALTSVRTAADKLKKPLEAIQEILKWLGENATLVKTFTTALAVIGIVAGLISGTWIPAIIGALVLLVSNFDWFKSTFGPAVKFIRDQIEDLKKDKNFQEFVAAIQRHVDRLRPIIEKIGSLIAEKVVPKLKELKKTFTEELLPALTSFIDAVSPIIAFLVEKFGPVVATVFGAVVDGITNAIKIISGIINVFSAIITGNWSKLWEGLKQIFGGVWGNIVSAFRVVKDTFLAVVSTFVAGIKAKFESVKTTILNAFKGAGDWLKSVGTSIVDGLANAITNAWGRVSSAVGGLVQKAKDAIPAPIRSALGFSGLRGGWAPSMSMATGFSAGPNFAMAGAGVSRTQAPLEVNNVVKVNLDGAPVDARAARVTTAMNKREQDRQRVGKR